MTDKKYKFKVSFNDWLSYDYSLYVKSLVNFFMKDASLFMHYTNEGDLSSCIQSSYEVYNSASEETSKYTLYIPYSSSPSLSGNLLNNLPSDISSFDTVKDMTLNLRNDSDTLYSSVVLPLYGGACTANITSNYISRYLRPLIDSYDSEYVSSGVYKINFSSLSSSQKCNFQLESDHFWLSSKKDEPESDTEENTPEDDESTNTDDTSSTNQDEYIKEVYYKLGICPLSTSLSVDGLSPLQEVSLLRDSSSLTPDQQAQSDIDEIINTLIDDSTKLAAGFFNNSSNEDEDNYTYYSYIASKKQGDNEDNYNSDYRFIKSNFNANLFYNVSNRLIMPFIVTDDVTNTDVIKAILFIELYDASNNLPFTPPDNTKIIAVKLKDEQTQELKDASMPTTDFGEATNNIAALNLSLISGD